MRRRRRAWARNSANARTRKALTNTTKIYELIQLCAQWHPKRGTVDPVLDLAVLVPWVAPAELKQYKRAVGESQCGDKVRECDSRCRCESNEFRCRCKEQCKLDRNSCMAPYLN
jgi:hypothetical protein